MKRELHFTIDAEGNVTLKVVGSAGSRCLTDTQAIERTIGEVSERQLTGDFYRSINVISRNEIKTREC